MKQFTKRNLLLYFRDKGTVFFSLLAVMITFLLYIFVFRNLYGMNLFSFSDIRSVTDCWAIGGILSAPTVTAPLGALWVLVDDRKRKLYQDFYTSPISQRKLTGGYLCASYLIGIIMTCILLVVTQIYLLINGGDMFSVKQIVLILCTVLVSTFSGAGFAMLLVSAFRSNNAYSFCSIVIGTLIGFISGNYIPIGMLPGFVQTIIKLCPVAHTAALFRQIVVEPPILELMADVPKEELTWFYQYMGITFQYADHTVSPLVHIAVLLGTGALFYAMSILVLSKKRTK